MRRSWRLPSLACLVLACSPHPTPSVSEPRLEPDGWRAQAQELFPGLEQSFVTDLEPSGTWWCAGAGAEFELEAAGHDAWVLSDAWDELRPPTTVVCVEGVLVPVEPLTGFGPEPVAALFPVRVLDGVWLVPDTELSRLDLRAPAREEFQARAFRLTGPVADEVEMLMPLEGF